MIPDFLKDMLSGVDIDGARKEIEKALENLPKDPKDIQGATPENIELLRQGMEKLGPVSKQMEQAYKDWNKIKGDFGK